VEDQRQSFRQAVVLWQDARYINLDDGGARARARHEGVVPRMTEPISDPDQINIAEPDKNGYRSFYVSDAVFLRFRAAVHWTSRRAEIADRVHENMSVAVEDFMRRTANRLESEFNDGNRFPPTPGNRRRRRD
jgi:hypothetical protein